MKVMKSTFLSDSKPLLRKLINKLYESYRYVSVLGTDTKGKTYRVSKTGTVVTDYFLAERGFVVRIHNGVNYSEYSFNDIDEDRLNTVVEEIHTKLNRVPKDMIVNSYPVLQEEEITREFCGEVEIDPEQLTSEQILKDLTAVRDAALAGSEHIVNFNVSYSFIHVSKIFLSGNKDLEQSYMLGESSMFAFARREGKIKDYYKSLTGMQGYEITHKFKELYEYVVDQVIKLLDAKPVVPGEYEVICDPDIAGLIAHEAFGHGVEMDMFVKERAKGDEFIGKQVASVKTTMHDGAAAIKHMASYLFDDEGTLGTDTIEIQNGILKSGISDLLSALKLGTIPTGNGRRQSFERKAYARMTNTFFEAGDDSYEDMLASIQYGYQLEYMFSGMEDPKNWGIQCIAGVGREIKDGKFTGNLISPVIMTGYVPELLKSISMVSDKVELEGAGYCWKGYKEIVKTSSGGPYIKAKARLS